jgi:glycosyltransferase involved in cell wall biosynthesis
MTICLSMIVKNEAHVIERCLRSVKRHIDYWVIMDTGSGDVTGDIVLGCLKDIPGRLTFSTFTDFSTDRNLALERAQGCGDWIFTIDADEVFLGDGDLNLDPSVDCYLGRMNDGLEYWRPRIVKNDGKWKYHGRGHDLLKSSDPEPVKKRLEGFVWQDMMDGARRLDRSKWKQDHDLLMRDLAEKPDDPRTVFYLAQNCRFWGQDEEALHLYRQRATMDGFPEEIYYSLWQIARYVGREDDFLEAYFFRPTRLEAIVDYLTRLNGVGRYSLAWLIGKGIEVERCNDILFVDPNAAKRLAEQVAIAKNNLAKNT